MHRKLISLIMIILTFSIFTQEASARGFGGRGFGGGRHYSFAQPHRSYTNSFTNKRPAISAARKNQLKGAFTGFLLGSMLSHLFMGNGFASGFSWLILGGIIWFIMSLIKRRN